MSGVPGHSDLFVLRHGQAEELAESLVAKGYKAKVETSGVCSTIDGEHVHLAAVMVLLTPAQARRLAGRPKAPK